MIDVSQPSQVRVEVWSANGQMMAFSNRILIQPLTCDTNANSQIEIADVQVVACTQAKTVPPAPARYDLRPDGRSTCGMSSRPANAGWPANRRGPGKQPHLARCDQLDDCM